MIATSAVVLALLSSADAFYTVKRQAARELLFDGIRPSKEIEWSPCNETQTVYMECARLIVPLDYQDPGNGLEAIIPIVKYPTNATGAAYKGAVLTNPGGPGYLGTEFIYNAGIAKEIAANVTGPGYDILGFDIRGVGYSVPYGSCNVTADELFDPLRQNATEGNEFTKRFTRRLKSAATIPAGAKDTEKSPYGFFIPELPPSFLEQTAAYADAWTAACVAYTSADNQAGPHMNTVVTATDMLWIARALARARGQNDTNALVHYYGISYGSVLGQTFATLYPDHVGKFVMDGIVNMDGWQTRTETDIVRNADQGFFEFFKQCFAAGPKKCAFATGICYQDTINRFNRMMSRFNATQAEVEESPLAAPLLALVAQLRATILDSLYAAIDSWEGLAVIFNKLDKATKGPIARWNVTEITTILSLPLSPPSGLPPAPLQLRTYSFFQTACGDAPSIYNYTISPVEEYTYLKASAVSGHARLVGRVSCSRYSIRPKWEWNERIGGKTKTPILFMGNTLDPVTPWDDAVKAALKFPGAEAVITDVIAHSTFFSRNTCAYNRLREYFQQGKLPGTNYKCAEEQRPFMETPHTTVIEQ
ncbi:hypothetical protein TWF481_003144 [Arthrobotrys musiformis]|uniref:Peptidase S33 tripeptidyl aminopeptidase-like C-terminal domain-containing protein n=1 Tax=Arthrobotrys musiformis TaxID=47236 RepID=A0AAV9VRD4_9PEZI